MLDRHALLDRLDQRILGGIRVTDHLSGRTIRQGIVIKAPGLKLRQAASGVWAVLEAEGMQAYARAFDPVPAQAPQEFDIEVHDTQRRFEPVTASLSLPRNAARDAAPETRVDTPVVISLPSAPGRGGEAGWSTVVVEVMTPQNAPVRGALVQVMATGTTDELGWTLTGARGQAVVPLTGLRHMQDVVVDDDDDDDDDDDAEPATITAITRLDIRVTAEADQPWPANPTRLRSGDAALRTAASAAPIDLKAGGEAHARITLTLN